MKIAYRLIEIIGDDAWVGRTIERSLQGTSLIAPRRMIRTHELGEREISTLELVEIEVKAKPPGAGGSSTRVAGDRQG